MPCFSVSGADWFLLTKHTGWLRSPIFLFAKNARRRYWFGSNLWVAASPYSRRYVVLCVAAPVTLGVRGFLFGFPQCVIGEQRNKDSAAQRPIPDNYALHIFCDFDTAFGILKIRFITNAPTISVL